MWADELIVQREREAQAKRIAIAQMKGQLSVLDDPEVLRLKKEEEDLQARLRTHKLTAEFKTMLDSAQARSEYVPPAQRKVTIRGAQTAQATTEGSEASKAPPKKKK